MISHIKIIDGEALMPSNLRHQKNNIMNISNLWNLKSGQSATITGFDAKLDTRYRHRVEELGFRPNAKVSCLKAPAFGAPKVYRINNSVFSLEDTIASLLLADAITV